MVAQATRALDLVLAALTVELRRSGLDEGIENIAKFPGEQIPADYADGADGCGGMAWVRLISTGPTAAFPSPDSRPNNCGSSLAYSIEVGILRPAPIAAVFGGREMDLPDVADHAAATDVQMEDMEVMYRALLSAAGEFEDTLLGSYTPLGPTGGVFGGSWDITVGLD